MNVSSYIAAYNRSCEPLGVVKRKEFGPEALCRWDFILVHGHSLILSVSLQSTHTSSVNTNRELYIFRRKLRRLRKDGVSFQTRARGTRKSQDNKDNLVAEPSGTGKLLSSASNSFNLPRQWQILPSQYKLVFACAWAFVICNMVSTSLLATCKCPYL